MSVHGLVRGFREFAGNVHMARFRDFVEFTGTTEWLWGLYVVVLPETVHRKIVVPISSTQDMEVA